MIFERNRCIRRATVADAPLLAAWWNDGRLMAHAGFPNGTGQTAEQIAQDLRTDPHRKRQRFILEQNHKPVGEMVCMYRDGQTAEIGIKICVEAQNQGLGPCYLTMLCGWLFSHGTEKIIVTTDRENHRAQHVYERLGFRRTAALPDAFKDPQGILHTSLCYNLTPTDFRCAQMKE